MVLVAEGRAPSMQIIPTLGPNVYRHHLLLRAPRASKLLQAHVFAQAFFEDSTRLGLRVSGYLKKLNPCRSCRSIRFSGLSGSGGPVGLRGCTPPEWGLLNSSRPTWRYPELSVAGLLPGHRPGTRPKIKVLGQLFG